MYFLNVLIFSVWGVVGLHVGKNIQSFYTFFYSLPSRYTHTHTDMHIATYKYIGPIKSHRISLYQNSRLDQQVDYFPVP